MSYTTPQKTVLVFIALIGGINLIFASVLLYEAFFEKEEKEDAELVVDDVYFVLEESSHENYRLSVKVFITNVGEKECEVKVRGFAIDEQSNIAMDDAGHDAGTLQGEATTESSLSMELMYNGSFRVELMVFLDGMVTVKGQGNVDLSDQAVKGLDYETTEEISPDGEKGEETPGPGTGLVLLGVFILTAVIYFNRQRRWRE